MRPSRSSIRPSATARPSRAFGVTSEIASRSPICCFSIGRSIRRSTRSWLYPRLSLNASSAISCRWRKACGVGLILYSCTAPEAVKGEYRNTRLTPCPSGLFLYPCRISDPFRCTAGLFLATLRRVTAPQILDWRSISSGFRDGLLVGNGSSMAVDGRFAYSSLWEHAQKMSAVGEDVERIFSFLKTADFEFVLRTLWHAQNVNVALGLSERRTTEAYESVRNALVAVVRAIHPAHIEVEAALNRGVSFLGQFSTVASLCYDLILYWTILIGNAANPNRFKDCFLSGEFRHDWRRFREPFAGAGAATLVFYPHGNLALGGDVMGVEQKTSAVEFTKLLDTVVEQWQTGRLTPLVVSEGTSDQKLRAIRRSPYLLTVYEEVLPELGESLAIFGWSLSDQDDHLLSAICRNRPKRIAVSVRKHSSRLEETMARTKRKLDQHLSEDRYELFFYDAASSGAWTNT